MWGFDEESQGSRSSSVNNNQQEQDNELPNYLNENRSEEPIVELSSSPVKKVQFQVGGGPANSEEDLEVGSLPLQQFNETGQNRAEKSDYSGSVTAPLLSPIKEERPNGKPQYHHSVSMIDTVKFGIHSSAANNEFQANEQTYGFVELDVLSGDGDLGSREWKETARWIKYEEDLEEGSGRWGRPHVASLSFHSLLKLRQLIERDGLVMLDLEEHDMPGIAYRVVEELVAKSLIRPDESPMLMRVLLLKHKHVTETPTGWFGLKRINTSMASLQNLYDDKGGRRIPVSNDPCVLVRRNSSMVKQPSVPVEIPKPLNRTASGNFLKPANSPTSASISDEFKGLKDVRKDSYAPSEEDLKWMGRRDTIRRLLPSGAAEATMIMVGDFDDLRKPIFIFVRLAEAQLMFNITEIPVPTRFFSILMVPASLEMDIIEIGRSFGALMSNKSFNELALRANGRKHLLTGINEFLDDSIVLPPGDWENQDILPLHVLQAKSKAIKMRRMKNQFSFSIRPNESVADGFNVDAQQTEEIEKSEQEEYDPFKRTGRLFGGLIADIKKRYPYYWSDFSDAMNFQCFSTIMFMYFASIGLIITFAGLMGDKTEGLIGMSETLTATAVSGIFFTALSAQPLIPVGPTGALLVFDEILFKLCGRYEIEFLPLRAWISFWLFLITFIVVAAEGSVLVKWFTKFTQDIFAALTALLLIFESVDNLTEIYEKHPLAVTPLEKRYYINISIPAANYSVEYSGVVATTPAPIEDEPSHQPNTALLSTILMLGTFFLAFFLKEFRNSNFLGEKTRRTLGDFGVPIALSTMVFLDVLVTDTFTLKVKVPEGFAPSSPELRGWFINPFVDFNLYIALGSLGPALLLFILIFMSQQICELLINSKERHLRKGSGFHFDLLLMSIINVGSGLFGAPWLCCATVRAIGHVTALTLYSKNNPPGEKPTIVKVHEQRVTNLAVSILVGCSVLLSPLLAQIPMAVLFGVFLYMGVTSLAATQLFERFSLFFIPVELHPQTPYVRRVRTWKMHMYTLIQIICLGLLWTVKSVKEISLAFPLFFILLVPIRLMLRRVFDDNELEALDGRLQG